MTNQTGIEDGTKMSNYDVTTSFTRKFYTFESLFFYTVFKRTIQGKLKAETFFPISQV